MEQRDGLQVSVNGDPLIVPAGTTVSLLLAQLGLDTRKVAIERNEAIVPRSRYDETALCAADQVEIVHFIGGG